MSERLGVLRMPKPNAGAAAEKAQEQDHRERHGNDERRPGKAREIDRPDEDLMGQVHETKNRRHAASESNEL